MSDPGDAVPSSTDTAWWPGRWRAPDDVAVGIPWRVIVAALPALVCGHIIAYSSWKAFEAAAGTSWSVVAPALVALAALFFAMGYLLDRERRHAEPPLRWIIWFLVALTAGQLFALLLIHGLDSTQHATAGIASASEHGHAPAALAFPWGWTLGGAAAASLAALVLRWIHHHKDKLRGVTILAEHRLATGGSNGTPDGQHADSLSTATPEPPIVHMILPLSPPRGKVGPLSDGGVELRFVPTPLREPGPPALRITPSDRTADRARIATRVRELIAENWHGHNWQQIARAIVPHAGTLRRVWLIGSVKSDGRSPTDDELARVEADGLLPEVLGSAAFIEQAARFIRALFPFVEVSIVEPAEPLCFHRVDPLRKTVLAVINEILRDGVERGEPVLESQIVVEATGALKTSSIVGAMCTLHNHTRFQYVATNPPNEAIVFNVSDARSLEMPG